MSDPKVTTCTGNLTIEYPDGTTLDTLSYEPKDLHLPNWYRCTDCGVAAGGKHHPNCDQELCPKCKGALVGCDCFAN
jgi:hypothetical protein